MYMLTETLRRYVAQEEQPMIAATVVLHALLMLKASDVNRIIIETPKPVEPAYVLPIDRPAYFKYTSKA